MSVVRMVVSVLLGGRVRSRESVSQRVAQYGGSPLNSLSRPIDRELAGLHAPCSVARCGVVERSELIADAALAAAWSTTRCACSALSEVRGLMASTIALRHSCARMDRSRCPAQHWGARKAIQPLEDLHFVYIPGSERPPRSRRSNAPPDGSRRDRHGAVSRRGQQAIGALPRATFDWRISTWSSWAGGTAMFLSISLPGGALDHGARIRAAEAAGKPILAFLLDPDTPWPTSRVDAMSAEPQRGEPRAGFNVARFRSLLGTNYWRECSARRTTSQARSQLRSRRKGSIGSWSTAPGADVGQRRRDAADSAKARPWKTARLSGSRAWSPELARHERSWSTSARAIAGGPRDCSALQPPGSLTGVRQLVFRDAKVTLLWDGEPRRRSRPVCRGRSRCALPISPSCGKKMPSLDIQRRDRSTARALGRGPRGAARALVNTLRKVGVLSRVTRTAARRTAHCAVHPRRCTGIDDGQVQQISRISVTGCADRPCNG